MSKSFAIRRLYPQRSELEPLLWVAFGLVLALLTIAYLPLLLAKVAVVIGAPVNIASLQSV